MIKIGYNDSDKHFGSTSCFEKSDRINNCINNLKKILNENTFINPDKYFLLEGNKNKLDSLELVNQVHSKKYIDSLINYKTTIFKCHNCMETIYSKEKVSFEQMINEYDKCHSCANKLNTDNIYCYITKDTCFTSFTFNIALEAISICKLLLDEMHMSLEFSKQQETLDKQIKYAFALVRPPGHHCNNEPNGFCVFNNVFVATKYAQKLGWNKVLILDIDFHHGDGTQKLILESNNPNISFVSIHGYGDYIYPGTGKTSFVDKNILNIPLEIDLTEESREYIDDIFYQNIIETQVMPYIQQINPDMIIVSLGFDAHCDDPLEGLNISDSTYIFITEQLKNTNKNILFVTEGGYNVDTINRLIQKMIKILTN